MAQRKLIDELISKLGESERVTKDAMRSLSRDVLEYVMVDGGNGKASEDSQVINQLLAVLTPVNKKVAMAFFQHFAAFNFNADDGTFGKKDKQQWARKVEKVEEFLKNADNDIWVWADRNIEVAPKPMDFAKLNQAMGQLIKKADKANLGHGNIVRAMLANGISPDELLEVIQAMADEQPGEQVEEQPAQAAA